MLFRFIILEQLGHQLKSVGVGQSYVENDDVVIMLVQVLEGLLGAAHGDDRGRARSGNGREKHAWKFYGDSMVVSPDGDIEADLATPYRLRHTHAQHLLEAGVSVFEIKEMLGHDDKQ